MSERDQNHAAAPASLAEAQAFVTGTYHAVTAIETIPVHDAPGRILAEDVTADITLPRFPASAMDGFAVRDADFAEGQPTMLRIAGTARAGHPWPETLAPGQAVRIFTGAMVPDGADRVLMQEDCRIGNGTIVAELTGKRKRHIRQPGEDVTAGQRLIAAGTVITAAHRSLLLALQVHEIRTRRPLKVALLSTGDELREASERLERGQIVDSNGPFLKARLQRLGCDVDDRGILSDDAERLLAVLVDAARDNDLIITSGGASVGAEDHLRGLIARRGFLEFWHLRMKPGKPVGLGDIDDCPILMLPGNPMAAAVTFTLLGEWLVARLSGNGSGPRAQHLPLLAAASKTTDRLEVLAARLVAAPDGRTAVAILEQQGSASLLALANAEGLAVIPPSGQPVAAGTLVAYHPLA